MMERNRLDALRLVAVNLRIEGQSSRADCVTELCDEIARLQSWQESIRVEVGPEPSKEPKIIRGEPNDGTGWRPLLEDRLAEDIVGASYAEHYKHRAEHLAAKLVEVQKMLVSIRDGGLIPVHFKRTHAKLAELIGLDDGRRYFDDFIDELSPAPKVGSHE